VDISQVCNFVSETRTAVGVNKVEQLYCSFLFGLELMMVMYDYHDLIPSYVMCHFPVVHFETAVFSFDRIGPWFNDVKILSALVMDSYFSKQYRRRTRKGKEAISG
jgi:hypothetical protein